MMMKKIVKIDIYFIIQLPTDEIGNRTFSTEIKRFKILFSINMEAPVSTTEWNFLHQATYEIMDKDKNERGQSNLLTHLTKNIFFISMRSSFVLN